MQKREDWLKLIALLEEQGHALRKVLVLSNFNVPFRFWSNPITELLCPSAAQSSHVCLIWCAFEFAQEVENVRRYRDQVKALNSELKSRKEEVQYCVNGTISEFPFFFLP